MDVILIILFVLSLFSFFFNIFLIKRKTKMKKFVLIYVILFVCFTVFVLVLGFVEFNEYIETINKWTEYTELIESNLIAWRTSFFYDYIIQWAGIHLFFTVILCFVFFVISPLIRKIRGRASQIKENIKYKNIPEICPHCKNPNPNKLTVCEWCGNKIC